MQYYWLIDGENQLQFKLFWKRWSENDGNYFMKHHAKTYHRIIRLRYDKYIVSHVVSFIVNKDSSNFQPTSNTPTISPIILQDLFKNWYYYKFIETKSWYNTDTFTFGARVYLLGGYPWNRSDWSVLNGRIPNTFPIDRQQTELYPQ